MLRKISTNLQPFAFHIAGFLALCGIGMANVYSINYTVQKYVFTPAVKIYEGANSYLNDPFLVTTKFRVDQVKKAGKDLQIYGQNNKFYYNIKDAWGAYPEVSPGDVVEINGLTTRSQGDVFGTTLRVNGKIVLQPN